MPTAPFGACLEHESAKEDRSRAEHQSAKKSVSSRSAQIPGSFGNLCDYEAGTGVIARGTGTGAGGRQAEPPVVRLVNILILRCFGGEYIAKSG
jgi:hypothetical protein